MSFWAEGGKEIAEVRPGWLRVHVITRYRVRTPVERWQIQDRLRTRLSRLGHPDRPRFYETPDGRLAFSLRRREAPLLLSRTPRADPSFAALERIDHEGIAPDDRPA